MRLKYLFACVAAAVLAPSPAGAEWLEASSRHFVIYANQDEASLREFAGELERFNAAVRSARGLADVTPGKSSVVTLFVVPDINAVQSLYGGDGVGGFYQPKSSGSVAFIPRKADNDKWGLSGRSIFFHEYMHHLMLEDSDVPFPIWVSEGSAEFFATPKFGADGSVTFGSPPLYREGVLTKMGDMSLTRMLSGNFTYVRMDEFASIYGRGWMLVHYLAFNQARRGQLTTYLNGIASGVPALKAAQDAFGDLVKLESELNAYRKRNQFALTTVAANKLAIPPISIRRLSAAEGALMDEKQRYERGSKRFAAEKAVAAASDAARQSPNDGRVQILLADFALAAKKSNEALAAADRAVALMPASYDALIVRAKALAAVAEKDKDKSDWDNVRRAYRAANKVDPEAAEPLIGFYRSYVSQGVRPTKNAGDGLAYALALAPQDDRLRMEIVGHLIDDDRLADARSAMMPLAYDPHAGKRTEANRAIFDALKANNRTLAKEKWHLAQHFYDADD